MPSGAGEVDSAFASPGGPWIPVSPRLATARRIVLALTCLAAIVAVALLRLTPVPAWFTVALAVAVIVVTAWAWWLIGRRVASYGYAEREGDLLVVSGILTRRLVIVPYGRMQMVDLRAGPIDRALGIATVQLHTAAATTDATIPGLPPEVAVAVRDRLAARGEQRSAGL